MHSKAENRVHLQAVSNLLRTAAFKLRHRKSSSSIDVSHSLLLQSLPFALLWPHRNTNHHEFKWPVFRESTEHDQRTLVACRSSSVRDEILAAAAVLRALEPMIGISGWSAIGAAAGRSASTGSGEAAACALTSGATAAGELLFSSLTPVGPSRSLVEKRTVLRTVISVFLLAVTLHPLSARFPFRLLS